MFRSEVMVGCLMAMLVTASAEGAEPTGSGPPLAPSDVLGEAVRATVRVDPAPGSKQFQGVWLVTPEEELLIAYRPDPLWVRFQGLEVRVEGVRYHPDPDVQAILAQHFRVHTLVVDPGLGTHLVGVGPERTLIGSFEVGGGQVGSKREGESWRMFRTTDGDTFSLANEVQGASGGERTVSAREVTWSPFVAHAGGRTLWIVSVKK